MQLLFIQIFRVTHCDAFLAVFGVASSLVISQFFSVSTNAFIHFISTYACSSRPQKAMCRFMQHCIADM